MPREKILAYTCQFAGTSPLPDDVSRDVKASKLPYIWRYTGEHCLRELGVFKWNHGVAGGVRDKRGTDDTRPIAVGGFRQKDAAEIVSRSR